MFLAFMAASLAMAEPPQDKSGLGYLTAADLAIRCVEDSVIGTTYCYGFIAAVHDSVRAYESWLRIREFCLPGETAQADLRRAFLAYLDTHAAERGGQAASVVVAALKQSYPCRTGG